ALARHGGVEGIRRRVPLGFRRAAEGPLRRVRRRHEGPGARGGETPRIDGPRRGGPLASPEGRDRLGRRQSGWDEAAGPPRRKSSFERSLSVGDSGGRGGGAAAVDAPPRQWILGLGPSLDAGR